MDYKGFGNRVKQERKNRNLTQSALAKAINKSDTYIGAIERGERIPSLETAVSLANRLEVTIDYLLADSVSDNDSNLIKQVKQIFDGQPLEHKQLAIKVLRTIFSHFEKDNKKNKRDIDLEKVPVVRKQNRILNNDI